MPIGFDLGCVPGTMPGVRLTAQLPHALAGQLLDRAGLRNSHRFKVQPVNSI